MDSNNREIEIEVILALFHKAWLKTPNYTFRALEYEISQTITKSNNRYDSTFIEKLNKLIEINELRIKSGSVSQILSNPEKLAKLKRLNDNIQKACVKTYLQAENLEKYALPMMGKNKIYDYEIDIRMALYVNEAYAKTISREDAMIYSSGWDIDFEKKCGTQKNIDDETHKYRLLFKDYSEHMLNDKLFPVKPICRMMYLLLNNNKVDITDLLNVKKVEMEAVLRVQSKF